jgi:hypothetical protein
MAKRSTQPAKTKKGGARRTATAKRPAKKSAKTASNSAAKRGKAARTSPRGRAAAPIKLGRPKVTADEELDLLFHDDYQARQVFAFLRVRTVGELEQLRPQEIIDRLIAPTVATVERIRRRLAEKNRALNGDEAFAAAHLAALKEVPAG